MKKSEQPKDAYDLLMMESDFFSEEKDLSSSERKIELVHIVENTINDLGERIEGIFPLLATLDPQSDEFYFLNKMWMDWCSYLNYG